MNSIRNIIFVTLIVGIVYKFNDTVNATNLSQADQAEGILFQHFVLNKRI